MKKIVQILLFVISYAPLYLILFFQNINDTIYREGTTDFIGIHNFVRLNITSLLFLALIFISITLYFLFFNIVLKSSSEKYTIKEIKSNSSEHMSYLSSYILPFIGLQFDSWQSILATLSLFYVLGHIYIKTNMILTNPTLTFFGYAISSIVDHNDKTKLLIHKKGLIKDKELDFVPLVENIYILKKPL